MMTSSTGVSPVGVYSRLRSDSDLPAWEMKVNRQDAKDAKAEEGKLATDEHRCTRMKDAARAAGRPVKGED
jgi:hypothetical protein